MPDSPARIRVAIIDGQRMFAESLGRLLDGEPDISVEGIGEVSTAAAWVARAEPDVVLVDHQLPGRDGIELARTLKALHPGGQVILLRDSWSDRALAAAAEAGCSGFLTKDQPVADVTKAVRAVAAGGVLLSPAMLVRLLPRAKRPTPSSGEDLTSREVEVLSRLAAGASNKLIASELNLSVNTIRNYVQSVLRKLGAHSKLEAVSIAARAGLIDYGSE